MGMKWAGKTGLYIGLSASSIMASCQLPMWISCRIGLSTRWFPTGQHAQDPSQSKLYV